MGYAGTKRGSALGPATISGIVETIRQMPQLEVSGLDHLQTLALLVPGIAEDRISDLTASMIKGGWRSSPSADLRSRPRVSLQ